MKTFHDRLLNITALIFNPILPLKRLSPINQISDSYRIIRKNVSVAAEWQLSKLISNLLSFNN